MKKYRCTGCGQIHSWKEWEELAAQAESGVTLVNIIPGYTIHDMELRCSCGKVSRLYRYLVCKDCRHGELDPILTRINDKPTYKCVLGKSANGKCWEERLGKPQAAGTG